MKSLRAVLVQNGVGTTTEPAGENGMLNCFSKEAVYCLEETHVNKDQRKLCHTGFVVFCWFHLSIDLLVCFILFFILITQFDFV